MLLLPPMKAYYIIIKYFFRCSTFFEIFLLTCKILSFLFSGRLTCDYGKRTHRFFFATFAFSFITCAYWSGLTLLPEQDLNGSS